MSPASSLRDTVELGDLDELSLQPGEIKRLLSYADVARRVPRVGDQFGRYRLVEELGRGGMGVVFKAEHLDVNNKVAIKFMLDGELATDADILRFLSEAERQLGLDHAHVVKASELDCVDGQYFFKMKLCERSLASSLENGLMAPDWRTRVKLMAKVTRGVQYAHERGLLHRDLKPANILLDEAGEPRVADFGLAKGLGEVSARDVVAGTVGYMAPEQAEGSSDLTVAVDVYALGAILFELLTGRSAFAGSSALDVLEQLRDPAPAPPLRRFNPELAADLERVCARCLAKNPLERYPTAAALALDLECLLAGVAISISPASWAGRAVHWVRRHPKAAGAFLLVMAVVLAAGLSGRAAWQGITQQERADLDTNADIATGQAGAALFQLKEFADRVETAASDASIVRLAQEASFVDEPGEALKQLAVGFDFACVLDAGGRIRAQWPLPPPELRDRYFGFRDYYRGVQRFAAADAHRSYVARAHVSERDGEMKFPVAAPIFKDANLAGVVVSMLPADSVFGKVRMRMQTGRLTALLGPRDIDRHEANLKVPPERFVVVIHDALTRGKEVKVPSLPALLALFRQRLPAGEQLTLQYASPQRETDYVDPVLGLGKRWQAAFAPVGGTGYVVVVQTPRREFADSLRSWFASAF